MRHARGGEHRADLAGDACAGALVRHADRHLDDDAAGRFAPPARCDRADLGALRSGEAGARIADEDGQGLRLLAHRDRVTQTVIMRNAAGDLRLGRGLAAHHQGGEADERERVREVWKLFHDSCPVASINPE
jgi:hypothetical protein